MQARNGAMLLLSLLVTSRAQHYDSLPAQGRVEGLLPFLWRVESKANESFYSEAGKVELHWHHASLQLCRLSQPVLCSALLW